VIGAVERRWPSVIVRLPLVIFLGVYAFSCYVGALALLFSVRFRTLFAIFSGSDPVVLSVRDLTVVLLLLHLGPLALWAGYELSLHLAARRRRAMLIGGHDALPRLVPWFWLVLSVGVACWSLGRVGGASSAATAWLDYNAYVYARLRWFDTLGFFEFVNLYTVMPVMAAAVTLAERRLRVVVVCLVLVLALQFPLASRKPLLTSMGLLAFAAYIFWFLGRTPRRAAAPRRQLSWFIGLAVALYATYVGLTAMTIVRQGSQAFASIGALVSSQQLIEAQARRQADRARMRNASGMDGLAVDTGLTDESIKQVLKSRSSAIAIYIMLAPLTRTSVCAVVYPVIFPRWHPYYPPDVGLDILGWGSMPDDSLVVYRYLWPEHHRGAVGAPFHIVLYSQGGILIALAGAFVVGMLLAAAWIPVTLESSPRIAVALWGALILTLSTFLAIDSVRNSIVVSYGLAWGALAVALLECSGWLVRRLALVAAPVRP
jgi:hypothetical protein